MSLHPPIDIASELDSRPVSPYQRRALTVLGLCVLVDGFDVMAMAFVAPALVHAWGIDKSQLGPVFGAGLAGMLCGSLLLSWLADRVGRKTVLVASSLFFSLFTLLTVAATNVNELLMIRFVAGIGLGGIMPNATALAGELSPKRSRAALTMAVSSGFTLGAALGGLLAASMVPRWGWESVFYLGGLLPLLVARLVAHRVPESMQWRAQHDDAHGRLLARDLRRIDPQMPVVAKSPFVRREPGEDAGRIPALFSNGRATATVLLWTINFLNLLVLYFLTSWIPTLAHDAGQSLTAAMMLGTTLLAGGLAGAAVMGPLIDRVGFGKVLVPAAVAQAVLIACIGFTEGSTTLMFVVCALAGFCIYGGQPGVIALAGSVYPSSLRATGIGWSLGIGRVGSILGPVIGGLLLQFQWSLQDLLIATALPAALAAALLAVLCVRRRTPNEQFPASDDSSA